MATAYIRENKNAIPQLTAMFLAGMTSLTMWIAFRLPAYGTETIMAAIFTTFICYLINDVRYRALRMVTSLFLLGVFQLGIVMLLEQKFLLLFWFFGSVFLLARFMPNRPLAIIVVAMGSLTLTGPGGFEVGMNRMIYFLLLAPLELAIIALVRKTMGFVIYDPPLKPILGNMTTFEAWQLAMMMTLGLFLYKFFQLPFGDWIVYTIALVHMGGVFGGDALKRALQRFYCGPLGLYLGFMYMAFFTWYAYQMVYLAVVFGLLGFYVSIRYGKYYLYAIFFMIFFMLLYDFLNPNGHEFSMLELFFSRWLNIGIGAAISLLGEPDASTNLAPEEQAQAVPAALPASAPELNAH